MLETLKFYPLKVRHILYLQTGILMDRNIVLGVVVIVIVVGVVAGLLSYSPP